MREGSGVRQPFKELDKENNIGIEETNSLAKLKPSPSPRKSPERKKLRMNTPEQGQRGSTQSNGGASENDLAEANRMEDLSPASDSSKPALTFSDDSDEDEEEDDDEKGVSTPPIAIVELNTRRNSLRPLSFSVESTKSNQSSVSSGSGPATDDDDNATVSLAAFQDLMNDDESDDDNQADEDRDSRRNTASPSALRQMLEMCDSDDDEEELLNEAKKRGQEVGAQMSQAMYDSPRTEEKVEDLIVPSTPQETPIATRTRGSGRKTLRTGDSKFQPTPLRSCISARKGKKSTVKKKVVFGSPDAAEFDTLDPVKGGVTPLAKTYAKTRFRMDGHRVTDTLMEEDGEEEDADTALNSSILATWDEGDEDDASSAVSQRRKSSSGRKRNKSSSPRGSGSSSRRASFGFSKKKGSLLPPSIDEVEEEFKHRAALEQEEELIDNRELQKRFEEAASEMGTPPPSPHTAEELVQQGKAVKMFRVHQDLEPQTPDSDDGKSRKSSMGSQGDTIDLQDLRDLTMSSEKKDRRNGSNQADDEPINDEDGGERTIELGQLTELVDWTPEQSKKDKNKKNSQRRRGAGGESNQYDNENHDSEDEGEQTVELGNLKDLASLGSANSKASRKSPRRSTRLSTASSKANATPERTVELGSLAELTAFSPTTPEESSKGPVRNHVDHDDDDSGEHTVELGSLRELAAMSAESNKSKPSGPKSSSRRKSNNRRGNDEDDKPGEERTVELGSLSELAQMSPNTPMEEAKSYTPPDVDDKNEQPVLPSPGIRLSFSSLASDEHEDMKSTKNTVFDANAMLNNFVDSEDEQEEEQQVEDDVQMEPETNEDKEEDEEELQRQQYHNADSAIVEEVGPSPPPATPQSNKQHGDNDQDVEMEDVDERSNTENAFLPKRALARTPPSIKLPPSKTRRSSYEGMDKLNFDQQHQGEMEMGVVTETKTNAETREIAENQENKRKDKEPSKLETQTFLNLCNITFPVLDETLLGGKTPEELGLGPNNFDEEPDVCVAKITEDGLDRACTFQADMYGYKWCCNELLNQLDATKATIQKISQGLSKQNPRLFQDVQNAQSATTVRTVVSKLFDLAQKEALILWYDLRKKGVHLSLQAGNDLKSILEEDHELVKRGVERLDKAIENVIGSIESCDAIARVDEEIKKMDQQIAIRKDEVFTLESRKVCFIKEKLGSIQSEVVEKETVLGKIEEQESQLAKVEELKVALAAQEGEYEVANGIHVWKLEDLMYPLVIFSLEPPCGAKDLLTVEFDDEANLKKFTYQHGQPASDHDEKDNNMQKHKGKQSELDSMPSIETQIENINMLKLSNMVALLNEDAIGKPIIFTNEVLRDINLEYGRLFSLWEEILEINQSYSFPISVKLTQRDCIEFSAEVLHFDVGAVVEATFLIRPGYPLAREACTVQFSVVSEDNNEELVEQLNAAVESNNHQYSFTPLTDIWSTLMEIFQT